MLDARLVADCRVRIRRACSGIGRIFAAFAVYVIELLGLGVVRLHVIVRDRPRRRDAPVMTKLSEVFLAQPKKRRTVKLGIAADVVVGMRVKFFTLYVAPLFFSLILAFEIDSLRFPIVLLAGNVVAALEYQYALA